MKKRIMKKLVAALRSGEYEQGAGQLVYIDSSSREESFCCLGVLCDLATQEGEGEWKGIKYFDEKGEACDSVLPVGIQKWAGMKSEDGSTPSFGSLAHMNDSGTPFSEIADFIEDNYKDL